MLHPNGAIIICTDEEQNGIHTTRYGWQGGDYVEVDKILLANFWPAHSPLPVGGQGKSRWKIGPFRLRALEDRNVTILMVRERRFWTNLVCFAYKSSRWLDLFYRRLIVTACIWGLGQWNPARVPTLADLFIVERWKARMRKPCPTN